MYSVVIVTMQQQKAQSNHPICVVSQTKQHTITGLYIFVELALGYDFTISYFTQNVAVFFPSLV